MCGRDCTKSTLWKQPIVAGALFFWVFATRVSNTRTCLGNWLSCHECLFQTHTVQCVGTFNLPSWSANCHLRQGISHQAMLGILGETWILFNTYQSEKKFRPSQSIETQKLRKEKKICERGKQKFSHFSKQGLSRENLDSH